MVLKRIGIVLFLIFFLLPNHNLRAQDSNAGFVPGNIWYSQDPFEEGDKIKINYECLLPAHEQIGHFLASCR